MSEVWITNPALGAAHDLKVRNSALVQYLDRGYEVREDQNDPEPEIEALPTPAPPTPEPPAAEPVGTKTTRKGS